MLLKDNLKDITANLWAQDREGWKSMCVFPVAGSNTAQGRSVLPVAVPSPPHHDQQQFQQPLTHASSEPGLQSIHQHAQNTQSIYFCCKKTEPMGKTG